MTEFTEAKLAELRAVAEAATEGPWSTMAPRPDGRNAVERRGYDLFGGKVSELLLLDTNPADAEHVATFDPPTVLRLIDALEGLSTTNENLVAYARKAEAALEAKTAEVDAKADYVSDLDERVRQRDNHVIPVLHARIKEAERDRDEARAEARFWMDRRATEAQIDQFNRERADRAEAALERVREARAGYPECDKYDDDSPVKCGWMRTVQSIDAALQAVEEAAR